MKLVIFDVNNASCSLAVCPKGYSIMVDCGSHTDKCPIDVINDLKDNYLNLTSYKGYDLTLLHITHPDDDHVKNAKKVREQLRPYLLHRRKLEQFPSTEKIHDDYRKHIDEKYRGSPVEFNEFGFEQNKTFRIPMDVIINDEVLSQKLKNNSSILRFIEYGGKKILFGGDMETPGWNWLTQNDTNFIDTLKKGLDILIAPHHGHKSGFPTALFDLTGNVDISILSKASEAEIENTDIASQYSLYSNGITYTNLNDGKQYFAEGTLTTRSNGHIFFEISEKGEINVITQKASSNHTPNY